MDEFISVLVVGIAATITLTALLLICLAAIEHFERELHEHLHHHD